MKNFEQIIKLLKEYKEQYGNCLVPIKYNTEDGIHLGTIVHSIRRGQRKTTPAEKAILDSIGFVWKIRESSCSFEEAIKLLKEYKEQYGDCLVPHSYVTKNGIYLGHIISSIRTGQRKTTPEEKSMLDSLGFVWKMRESSCSFEEVIKLLKEYKEQHSNCLVPFSYITDDGIRLGQMVNNLRTGSRKTSPEEKAALDDLGFVWKMRQKPCSLKQVIKLLKVYKKQHGTCLVPFSYITNDGFHLGQMVNSIRTGNRKIFPEEKALLDSIGFVWKVKGSYISFVQIVILLKRYKEQYGDCLVPTKYTTEDGIHLGTLVHNIRCGLRKTTPEEKAILDNIGFVWRVKKEG